jgi:hypothetical protein
VKSGERLIAGITAHVIVAEPESMELPQTIRLIAGAYVELVNQVRALHDLVDQTDPHDPIGTALTAVGLAQKPPDWPTGPRLVPDPTPVSPDVQDIEQLAATYLRFMHGPDLTKYETFVVRVWDGMDGCWTDCTGEVSRDEALRVWAKHTDGGKHHVSYSEIDYYRIFPGGSQMLWDGSEGGEMHR